MTKLTDGVGYCPHCSGEVDVSRAAKETRSAALEEAAALCEEKRELWTDKSHHPVRDGTALGYEMAATAIRELKVKPPPKE